MRVSTASALALLASLCGCAGGWAPPDEGFDPAGLPADWVPTGYTAEGYKTPSELMMDMAAGMGSGPTAGIGFARGLMLQQSMPQPPMPQPPMLMPPAFPQTTTCTGLGPTLASCSTW